LRGAWTLVRTGTTAERTDRADGRRTRATRRGKLGDTAAMIPLMLVDIPDDRYRGHQRGTPWRRAIRLLAAAIACFLAGAFILPWVGFLLDIGSVVLVLLALCALDD
jgi:hypothetical protein